MHSLLELVKAGTLGASLAFLILTFWLLQREISLKDAAGTPVPPRGEALKSIGRFGWIALLFFLVGVLSELILRFGPDAVLAWEQHAFKDQLISARLSDWKYFPEDKKVGFSLIERKVVPTQYVLPAARKQTYVYVVLRRRTDTPIDQGKYDILEGPYSDWNQGNVERVLDEQDLVNLGNECIEFAVFSTQSKSNKAPFEPAKENAVLFDKAFACNH